VSLSPAAQAVFDAWVAPARIAPEQVSRGPKQALSQAIRAAADQVAPDDGVASSIERIVEKRIRAKLLAIAAELKPR